MTSTFQRILAGICILWTLAPAPRAQAGDDDGERERSFVASMAATVYAAAWPTATYKDWSYKSFNRVAGGGDLTVRLKGQSAFGGELWLDLVFIFRNGSFSDIEVSAHNALLVPPFETVKTAAAVAMELANEYSTSRGSAPVGAGPAMVSQQAPTYTRVMRQVRVASACKHSLSLWMQTTNAQGQLQTLGPWPIQAAASTLLGNSANVPIELSAAAVSYYAEIANANYEWSGDRQVTFGNRTFSMRTQMLPVASDGIYELGLDCSNLAVPNSRPTRLVGIRGRDVEAVELRGIKYRGVQIIALMHGYPAATAGLQTNDVITSVDGQPVTNLAHMQQLLAAAGQRAVLVVAQRADGPKHFTITAAPPPNRQPVDNAQCRERGNPPDYYLGAVAVPFQSFAGEPIVPLYPETAGRLFDPPEVDLYYHRTQGLYFYFGKPLRDDIHAFEYYDLDRAVLAVLESGQRLDLGVRIQCLLHPGLTQSTNVRLSRTHNGKVLSERVLPLHKK